MENRCQLRSRKHFFHATMIGLHLVFAVACYLFLPWEEIQKTLAIISAVLVTLFLTSLFIYWSIFGEVKSLTNDEGLMTKDS
jgi:NADH:ubiquinone oxidoreductase subunit 3 (subunit A)